MNRRITIILLVAFFSCLFHQATFAQENIYGRRQEAYDEAVSKMKKGEYNDAKERFEKLKKSYKGSLPKNNDLDEMIRKCTTLDFSPKTTTLQFSAHQPGTKSITVTTNAHKLSVKGNKWCHPSVSGTDNNGEKVVTQKRVITVRCDDNDNPTENVGSIQVNADGKTVSITVKQLSGELTIEVYPDVVDFSDKGGVETITVETNAHEWYIDSLKPWIDVVKNTNTFDVRVQKNNSPNRRSANIYVVANNETYPVLILQASSDSLVAVSKDELAFPATEATDSFVVMGNLSEWNVVSSEEWITAWVVQDTIRVRVTSNPSVISRHGRVKVGTGNKVCVVTVHQAPFVSEIVEPESEILDFSLPSKSKVLVVSNPSDLKVTLESKGKKQVKFTPFEMPADFGTFTLSMGFEKRCKIFNNQLDSVVFEPGMRFATITWSPGSSIGMMSGYVGRKSFGAYAHFRVNTPFMKDLASNAPGLSGYNMTFGPVYRPVQFPYVGLYAGVGVGAYVWEPHVGIDYEAGVMGFYKNIMLTAGFHTSRLRSNVSSTSFELGVGGYLKRYKDEDYGYCASDSRRWTSVNYVFRPSENGKGFMVGDLGENKVRGYVKALYLTPVRSSDSLQMQNIEVGFGIIVTPVNGLIDMCAGASVDFSLNDGESPFQGMGAEVGTIVNIWRFPLTVMLHEVDLFGERHLCVDFGVGFHFGKFGWNKSTYK